MHSPCSPQLEWPAPSTSRQRGPRASEIIPGLYISDLSFAESPSNLAALGVTHVLSTMSGPVQVPPQLGLHRMQIPLDDFPFAELAAYLPATTAYIRDALRDPSACVLVHCAEGISRSVSVVSAFLIAEYAWTPAEAINFVKERRRIADPNFGFIAQLQEYADSIHC